LQSCNGTYSAAKKADHKAVEESMHELMEYVFEPTYKRLRQSMASPPADKAGWKSVKSDALILAESSNLLLFREPEEMSSDWNSSIVAIRDLGGKLYQAAAKSDYDAAKGHYTAMLENCNQCHKVFAEGKYQLEP